MSLEKGYEGAFYIVSDPVDLLCRAAVHDRTVRSPGTDLDHVINRIEKLYRYDENNNSITNLDTTVDTPDISSYKLIINSTNDGSIVSGTTKLILIEGGY